jgi:putative ABC transport system permease protein
MHARRQVRLRSFAAKLRGLLGRPPREDDFDAEIHEHVRLLADRFVAQGMTREEASLAARRQFGNTALLQEERRALQTFPSIEAWWHDLRCALRTLWRSRAFTLVSIVTLGLGIGAATAMFSVIHNVLLEPFPENGAARMVFVRIHNSQQSQDQGRQGYTATEVLEFAENNHVFDGFTAALGESVLYTHGEGTEWLDGVLVTPGTFEFFGMPALHGRVMLPSDYEPGSPPVFVMRYKAWMERFGGDRSMLNRTFVLNGTPRTLVGIMPPRFGWYAADLYIPTKLTRDVQRSTGAQPYWFLLGRLRPGVSIEQAEADLTVIAHRLARIYPQNYPARFTVHVRSRVDAVVGRFAATLYTVLAAVGVLLLIASSNVATLMLARATTRDKELALRAALGAGRGRLVRLLMLESLILAMAGAALGTVVAWGGLTLLVAALQSSRLDMNDSLRDSGKGVTGGFRGRWLRDAVVVVEVALSLTLLIGAGLLMRSFVALREVRLGVHADHVFMTGLALPADRYGTAEQAMRLFRPLLLRLKALPGVVDAAVASATPPYTGGQSTIQIAGQTHEEERQSLFQHVSEDYFSVLRITFKHGRGFSEADVDDARHVAVVNETFVRKYVSNDRPLGQRVHLATIDTSADPLRDKWFEIIGVVGDVTNGRNRGLQVPIEPEVWVPYTTAGSNARGLMVRTALDPGAMMNAVRQEVWATDAGVALIRPGTLEDRLSEQLYAGPRFGFLLMTIFGCVGLILVTVGVYSVLAYSTTQRTHEIGIRMALGAEAADALGLVMRAGLRLVLAGIAIGIPVSLVLARVIGTELVGVTVYDPLTLAATTWLLTMTAAIACWIPARRAARVDPIVALRYE